MLISEDCGNEVLRAAKVLPRIHKRVDFARGEMLGDFG
jgi:hypothetical protein